MDSDCLLKIASIDGESTQKGHEKWIELISWTWGEHNAGSSTFGSGAGRGRVAMDDFVFTMNYGISSPKLLLACATGQHLPSAVLHVRKAGGTQELYMEWTFTDVLISSYTAVQGETRKRTHMQQGPDVEAIEIQIGEPTLPVETITFNFTKIEMEYKPQRKDGTVDAGVKTGYDVKRGCKI